MKIENLFEILDRYFLDFIGMVIPGIAFIVEISIILKQISFSSNAIALPVNTSIDWASFIILGYILGNGLYSIGKNVIIKFLEYLNDIKFFKPLVPIESRNKIYEKIKNSLDYRQAIKKARKHFSINEEDESEINSWRNIAMSLTEDNSLAYRFMFLSIMNLNIATGILLANILWCLLYLIKGNLGINFNVLDFNLVSFISILLVSMPFLERHSRFYEYSMKVHFSKALVKLQELENLSNERDA